MNPTVGDRIVEYACVNCGPCQRIVVVVIVMAKAEVTAIGQIP